MKAYSEASPADDGVGVFSLDAVRNAAVGALIVWVMLASNYPVPIHIHSPHMRRYIMQATVVSPLDIVFVVLAVVAVPLILRRATYDGWPAGLIGVLTIAVITMVFVVSGPTPEGLMRAVRFAGITGLVATIRWMSPQTLRMVVVWPLTLAVLIQASIGLAQTFILHNGAATTITVRWEHAWTQAYGTMDSPYSFAAFVAVGIAVILSSASFTRLHPAMWIAVILGSGSVSAVFGRIGALSLLMVGGVFGIGWLLTRKRRYFASAVATVLPMSVGIAVGWSGWQVRAAETGAGNLSGREAALRRAFTIIEANPVFGVGPGEFGPTLARIGLTNVDWTIVHNVPVLVAAEYGVPLGVMFTVWLGLLGVLALFTSIRAFAVFVVMVPLFTFAYSPVVYVAGVAGFGLWLAFLDYHRRYETERTALARASAESTVLVPAA